MESPGSTDSTASTDPALLDKEENPLEEGQADNVVEPSKQPYAVSGGGYNALKTHHGQLYSGMAIGGSHTWKYDPGVWKETKEEPDLWRIDYQTTKRRARNAPKGSGAPVGTEYHWLIVGHQVRYRFEDPPGKKKGKRQSTNRQITACAKSRREYLRDAFDRFEV